MATCSSSLAWTMPWTEEPGGLQSMGLQRVVQAGVTRRIRITALMLSFCPAGVGPQRNPSFQPEAAVISFVDLLRQDVSLNSMYPVSVGASPVSGW